MANISDQNLLSGDGKVNAPVKLTSGKEDVDGDLTKAPVTADPAPAAPFPARSENKAQPKVKLGSTSTDPSDQDEEDDLVEQLAKASVTEKPVPENVAADETQPDSSEKDQSQIKLPSSSDPAPRPPQTVNEDSDSGDDYGGPMLLSVGRFSGPDENGHFVLTIRYFRITRVQ